MKGYWQVPLTRLASIYYPGWLISVPCHAIRFKEHTSNFSMDVISRLEGCDAYIDDLKLYSGSWEDHIELLRKFFCRLRDAQLTINSEFYRAQVVFLGHIVGQGEVALVASMVDAIVHFPIPDDKHAVMRFLGLAAYYRKFFLQLLHCCRTTDRFTMETAGVCVEHRVSTCLQEDQIFIVISTYFEGP